MSSPKKRPPARPASVVPPGTDESLMRLALVEAARGLGRTSPNPAVGAVIARAGEVLATGFHAAAGTDHGEVAALRKLDFDARDCDLYTTLEPCDHTGRTGPCTEAILRAGIRRVVVGARDPNPLVSGRGLARLQRDGLVVRSGVLEADCTALNEAFNWAIVQRRPFVILKAGMSLDGRIATRTGHSQWITSPAARAYGYALRDRADAILVGVDTVIADDPQLTARVPGGRDPIRVVLDSKLRTPLGSKLVTTASKVRTLIATTRDADAKKRARLEARGVELLVLKKDREGRVDLSRLLEALGAREVNSLLVEGGGRVHGAFVDAGLVNKVALFLAPLLIGGDGAAPAVRGRGARRLEDALVLERLSAEPVGPDLLVTAYVKSPGRG